MSSITQYLHQLALRDGGGGTDGELLSAFVRRRDDAALAALVKRHGPMVWGVCRRLLRSHHDAEDAFQATFLVLVRKAAAVRDREAVANWLYGVAYQTAVRVRAAVAKRQRREGQVKDMPEPMARQASLWDDLQALLDLELSRLPDKYRVLIVLCDLEGKTRKQVARQLGCPEGTVAGRLARARVLLARRLARHGLAVSGGALAAVLSQSAAAAGVPAAVVSKTIRAAAWYAAGPAAAGLVPTPVAALAQGVLTAMSLTKLKVTTAGLVLAGLLVCGLLVAAPAGAPRSAPARQPAGENQDRPADKGARPKAPDGLKVRATLAGHGTGVYGLAFSPDGKLLASGSDDASIKIWDTATGKEVRTLTGHQGVVFSLAFSPDGKSLASTGRKSGGDFAEKVPAAVILWDVATGEEKVKLQDNDGAFQGVVFSPDGKVLAACDGSEQVKLWHTGTGKQLGTLKEEHGLIRALIFSPDGKTLLLGIRPRGEADPIRLWDWAEQKANGSLKMDGECSALRFTRDGKTLVTLNEHGEVTFWDFENWRARNTVKAGRAPGWAGRPRGLTLSADEKLLALGYATQKGREYAGKVDVRDAASGALVTTLVLDMVVEGVAFSPVGGMLAAGCLKDAKEERVPNAVWLQGQEGVVRIWDLRAPKK
jgi:RNA polymerase sigma factor (sigma-70 family)